MTWFRIDPAAKAIIKSLQSEPERWREGQYRMSLDGEPYSGTVELTKRESYRRLRIETPDLILDRRSERAMWKAYEEWKLSGQVTQEQRNRSQLIAALQAEPERGA